MTSLLLPLRRLIVANPMIHKELRGRMRGGRSFVILTVYLGLMALFSVLFYAVLNPDRNQYNYGSGNQDAGRNLLSAMVVFETIMVVFLAPAFTAGVISGERERQTFDLLMTTMLKPRSIVLGKMGAALAYLLLLILAVLPLESLAFMIGGVAPEEIWVPLVVLFCAALLYGSVGIFWSSLMRSTVAATVLTYGTVILVSAGLPFLWVMVSIFASANGNSQAMTQNVPYIYFSGIVLSSNPVLAMGISETLVRVGKPLFFYMETTAAPGTSFPVVQPWLVFCLMAVLFSLFFLAVSIRMLPPVRPGRRRVVPVPPAPAPVYGSLPPLPPAPPPGPPASPADEESG
ncbi:MAG TPA: ABC transporter permease subunit [Chloroflexia bacterium]|nr:ABC transporter permease subunit [Chloroflexia bacterium]